MAKSKASVVCTPNISHSPVLPNWPNDQGRLGQTKRVASRLNKGGLPDAWLGLQEAEIPSWSDKKGCQ
eukprot:1075101-Pelagomonas_calceolata.AAC.1